MFRRLVLLMSAAVLFISSWPAAGAQPARAIDVIKVSGPLDERMIDFTIDTINEVASTSELVIIQLNSPAALTERFEELVAIANDPPAPLAVWVGPETAVAYGGAVELLAAAPISLAAPGAKIGAANPDHHGPDNTSPVEYPFREAVVLAGMLDGRTVIDGAVAGVVDDVHPALTNIVLALHGRTVEVLSEERTLSITETFDDNGVERRRPITTRFHEQGFVDRALRLSLSPAVAYFFLLVGLSVAAFEFYAAGVGVAAAVSVLTILLSGYGIAVLPVNWWALGLGVLGLGLYLYDFQRIQLRFASLLGTAAMMIGARYLVHEPPQLSMAWWSAVLIVVAIAIFFLFAMTTVVRARFSTPTIGREHLIGQIGTAETAVAPEGVVLVEGARWKANSRRASGIEPGDRVVIAAVEGIVLEVDPVESPHPQIPSPGPENAN
jgi:membrane-bound serine protease (ClpP class)